MDSVASPRWTRIRRAWSLGGSPFAPIALSAGAGLLVCSIANALSRATEVSAVPLLGAGILMIAMPIFYRLTSRDASPGERLALVCLLGLSLYGIKLVRDAPVFTFSDELLHSFNSNQISEHNHLFHPNTLLEISRYYPGLEGVTSALRSLTGLSSFGAGAIVVGAGRLTLMSAMFFLFWRISGSDRIAGLGAALFAGSFNFLFWSVQYSYESLALPLLLVILLAVTEMDLAGRAARGAWSLLAAIAISAVVVTHHVTSYLVVGALASISLVARVIHHRPNPWRLALFAAGVTAFWLAVVASSTFGYLSPVLGEAFSSTLDTASGEVAARALFQGDTTVIGETPLAARGVALLAMLLLAAGLPFGLRTVWRRYRSQPIALTFCLAAIVFFGTLAARFVPEAWETANRASGFLFIGLAFVVACAGLELWRPRSTPWLGRALAAGALGVVVLGGAITGWPWDSQLSLPVRAKAADGGRTISSPPMGLALWAGENVPTGRFAALTADARFLADPGGREVLSDHSANIVNAIPDTELASDAVSLFRQAGIRFIVADQRVVANDGIRGYYFSLRGSPRNALLPRAAVTKFEAIPGVERVFDAGTIVVYDISGYRRPVTGRGRT